MTGGTVVTVGRCRVERHENEARLHEERALLWDARGEKQLARIERSRALIHARAAAINRELANAAAAQSAA